MRQLKYPCVFEKIPKVESAGGIKEPDLEKINQLKPDLIIISGRQQDYQEQLKAIAPTIYLAVDAKILGINETKYRNVRHYF